MEFSEGPETNLDRWKTMNSITRNYHTKYRRYRFVFGSVFVALVLIIVVTLIVTEKRDSHDNVPENSNQQSYSNRYIPTNDYEKDHPNPNMNLQSKLVLLIDGKNLVSFNYKSRQMNLLYRAYNSSSTIIAFDIHVDKYIYRSEKLLDKHEKYIIESTALIDSNVTFVLEKMQVKPIVITLDRITGHLYVIDKNAGNLIAISLRTGYYTVILKDLIEPREITMDLEQGIMFVLQFSHSILRANMDGSDIRKIIANNQVTAITINSSQKRVYWIHSLWSIQSTDYEGKNQQTFFIDFMRIKSLTVLDNQLFWTWPSFQNTTNLFSCKISENFTCENRSTYNVIGNVTSIRGYSTIDDAIIANPCQFNNCEQLCLMSGRNISVCRCPMGWNMDRNRCKEISDQDIVISWWKPL